MRLSMMVLATLLLVSMFACEPTPEGPTDGPPPVAGQPAYHPGEWKLVTSHIHSSIGGEKHSHRGLEHVREYANEHGIAIALLTDHNSIDGWFDPAFEGEGPMIFVGGEEWTSKGGHATIFGWDASGPADKILPSDHEEVGVPGPPLYAEMVAEVHDKKGVVIINHPRLKTSPWPGESFGADGVEVGPNVTDLSGRKAIAWWQSLLEKGEKLTAWGGSDYHYLRGVPAIDKPINRVRMHEVSRDALVKAVKARHVMVVARRRAPMVLVGADLDGDLVFDDAMMGDAIKGAPGKKVDLQVRVIGGKGQEMVLIETKVDGAGPHTKRTTVTVTSDDFVYRLVRERLPEVSQFLRVELGKTRVTRRPRVITNPIFW